MKYLAKNSFIIKVLVVFLGSTFLDQVVKIDNFLIRLLILISFAAILSPRKKIIQTQTGEKKQLTWIFFKKPIFLD